MNDKRPAKQEQKSVTFAPQVNGKISLNELSDDLPFVRNKSISDYVDLEPFDNQVAGHQFDGKEKIGLLKCKNGTVLKPINKENIGAREIDFYEQLKTTTNPSLLEFKEFCTNYHGTKTVDINGKKVKFLMLDDITDGMVEPCIIDIKIGKVTSDPEASEEKVMKEKLKYKQCKDDIAFCVPGFQVYKVSTERLHKYNKEYGKKLNGMTVIDALKIFLNADNNRIICRELIVKLLSVLWKIQKWARNQKVIRLYSSSLLIVYDCKKLRKILEENKSDSYQRSAMKSKLTRKVSFNSPESYTSGGAGRFSGQISSTGPILKLTMTPSRQPLMHNSESMVFNKPSVERKACVRSHSFHHNYNDYLAQLKKDYASTLKELINPNRNNTWFEVKAIDFAHTFSSDEPERDTNYIEGIDNLVRIFENFLECAE